MKGDTVLSNPVEVHPRNYRFGGSGRRGDVFHPQARFTSVKRIRRTLPSGPRAGEEVLALLVEGARPGALNLRVRRFVSLVTVDRREVASEGRDEELLEALEAYLSRC